MLKNLHLRDVGPSPKMDLDLAPRLNVLTGDNGLGKSFILDIAWWALTFSWAGEIAWPHRSKASKPTITAVHEGRNGRPGSVEAQYNFGEQDWSSVEYSSEPPDPGLIIYARVDGGFSVWDPARKLSKDRYLEHRDELRRPPAFHLTSRQVWDGFKNGSRVLCRGLIEDWALWQRAREPAFDLMRNVLRKLSPDENEILEPGKPTRVWIEDVRDIPTLKMPYGEVPVTLASAGVRRILALAYVLVWAWQEHRLASELLNRPAEDRILFLIDELEAHLHPKWQRTLLRGLLPIADELHQDSGHRATCQIITTTHAPLVMTSLEPIFKPNRDRIFRFDLVGSDVEVCVAPWRPRGDVSAWLTSEIFDLGQARSLEAERAISKAMEAMRRPDLELEDARKIHAELHRVLKDTDPFWVRWRYRAEQAGLEA